MGAKIKKIRVISERLIDMETPEDLVWQLRDEFAAKVGIDPNDYDDVQIIEIRKGYDYENADGDALQLSILEDFVKQAKEKGATHVRLEYHCDHITYILEAYKLTLAPEEENARIEEEARKKKIAYLKTEIKRQETNLQKNKDELDQLENAD